MHIARVGLQHPIERNLLGIVRVVAVGIIVVVRSRRITIVVAARIIIIIICSRAASKTGGM